MSEIGSKLFFLVNEKGLQELVAWNQTSQQLISAARVRLIKKFNKNKIFPLKFQFKIYTDLFIINASLSCINANNSPQNQQVLCDLFELYLLYAITDLYSANILKVKFPSIQKYFDFVIPQINSTHLL